jgi:Tfp pilus assembly protein PilE
MSKPQIKLSSAGFTLIEVLIIAPILVLMVATLVMLMVNLTTESIISSRESMLVAEVNTALDVIEDTVPLSSEFLVQKESNFSDPYGNNNSGALITHTGTSPSLRALLTRTYATSLSPKDPNREPVYININGCTPSVIGTNPVAASNIIFFVRNGNLYRRTLTDTSRPTCNTMFQQQSCPPEIATPNAICKAKDSLVLTDVTKFDIAYYLNSQDTAPISDVYSSTNPDVIEDAEKVVITLGAARTTAGTEFKYTSNITISRVRI